MSQLSSSMSHCEGVASEYKMQLERSRVECEELAKEMQLKEREIEQLKRENMINTEKVRSNLRPCPFPVALECNPPSSSTDNFS